MKPRGADDELVTVAIPKSALTVIAPLPATVTQKNCFGCFGISPDDFLRMAGRDFPILAKGKLRIARYADVEAALTRGAECVRRRKRTADPTPPAPTPDGDPDPSAILKRWGFRPKS